MGFSKIWILCAIAREELLGDVNVEPAEIGGKDGAMVSRRRRWSRLMLENGMELANPMVMGDEPKSVWLPIRNKHVHVGAGCTHHCAGTGRARALDVVAYKSQSPVSAMGQLCRIHVW